MEASKLIHNCKSGIDFDKNFYLLYKKYIGFVYSQIYKHVNKNRRFDTIYVNEIINDVFLKLHLNIHKLRVESDREMGAWLKTVCRNHIIDIGKKQRVDLIFDSIDEMAVHNDGEYEEDYIEKFCILDVLPKIPKVQAETAKMYYVHGTSTKEISEHFNTGEVTVRTNLMKARKNIKKEYEKVSNIVIYNHNTPVC